MYMNSQPYPYAQTNAVMATPYQPQQSYPMGSTFYQVRDDDRIVLLSLDEYLARQGYTPSTVRPDEWVRIVESAGDIFYSDIAQRITRIIPYINFAPIDDDKAKGLQNSLAHHMRNPRFVSIMMKQLYQENNPEANAFVGAFLVSSAEIYATDMKKLDEADQAPKVESVKKDKEKDKTPEPPKKSHRDDNVLASMYQAAMQLLSDKYEYVMNSVIGIAKGDALAVAAYLAMNNAYTVKALLKTNLPLTADIFEKDMKISSNPGNIIAALLTLPKADYLKLSGNQQKFMDTLIKWVYTRLDALPPTACLNYLVQVYHTSAPADVVKPYLIQLKDCGTQYPQLYQVVRALKLN